jgi:hypothetical protein
MFWKRGQAVACSLLTPANVLPGESAGLQVVLHRADRTAQAKALADWRGSVVLDGRVRRGTQLDLHVDFLYASVTKPLQTVSWSGLSTATIFNFRVSDTWTSGAPLQGALTITVDRKPIGRLEFSVPCGGSRSGQWMASSRQ